MGSNLEIGSVLRKRYRIVEILGQGGMGSVYHAVDENLGVDVAVKENLFTTDEYARQFRLEAVILANLRHDNLPRVTDHFVISGQGQYLIMDYIEGEDLRQRTDRDGNISVDDAIQIGSAMCDALQYLHTRQPVIIHRDLKPGNVRITPDGHIYLVDFGLAKLVKGSQATTTGARAMTPGYSPPEQYGSARTDPRTDIYSLGATLYAGLSGVIPEDGLARAMDNVELTPLRKRNPVVPRKLANAIEKAMAVRPEDRFQSAEEFKQALLTSKSRSQPSEEEIPVEAPPPSAVAAVGEDAAAPEPLSNNGQDLGAPPPAKPPREPRGARWWVFLAAFLLTILLLTLVSVLIFWTPISDAFHPVASPMGSTATALVMIADNPTSTPRIYSATSLPVSIETGTSLPVYTPSDTPAPSMTLPPTPTPLGGGQSQIAFASNRNGLPQIFLANPDGSGHQDQITNMQQGACQPSWSPDGMRIAFISPCPSHQDQYPLANIYLINVDGSGITELMADQHGDYDPAWSPDGKRIAFTSLRGGSSQIYVIQLSDNSVTAMTSATGDINLPNWSFQPAWSPDGTQILFTGHSPMTNVLQIWVMSDTGHGLNYLVHRGSALWNYQPDWSPDGKTILFSETKGHQLLGWLMRFNFDLQTQEAVHLRAGTFGDHGDFSPDGKWVAYQSVDLVDTSRHDLDIYITRSDGTGPITRLTNSNTMEFDPAWRPSQNP